MRLRFDRLSTDRRIAPVFVVVAIVGAGLHTGPSRIWHGLRTATSRWSLSSIAAVQQHPPIDAKVTGKAIDGTIAYSNPALRIGGTMEPASGRRFYIVELAVGESDVEAELETFRLVAGGGVEFVAMAAGGGANLLFPIERLPMGREMTQILPVDGIIAVTRNSATSVLVETTPKATLALLYEIPADASIVAVKLPDGSTRSLR